MRIALVSLAFALLLPLPLRAQQAVEPSTPEKRLAAMQADVASAERSFYDAWHKQADPEVEDPATEKLFEVYIAKQRAGFAEAFEIAKSDPASTTAFHALEWLLATPRAYHADCFPSALKLLIEHHSNNPEIGSSIAILAYYPPRPNEIAYEPVVALFNTVVAKNPDQTARGQAALGLAWLVKHKFEMAEFNRAEEASRLAGEAEAAFEAVIRDYGDCKNLRTRGARTATTTLRGEAEAELFELRNLRVGKPAPEIEAEDLAGAKFKLSDYRGKVTLLAFWASWCGPCMGAVPHERRLVDHFQSRPFVLIGVNGDESLETAGAAVKKHQIPWRSFWNGKEGRSGPIAHAWNVRGWPTVYVIDHRGIIRETDVHGEEELKSLLEPLIVAAELDEAARDK